MFRLCGREFFSRWVLKKFKNLDAAGCFTVGYSLGNLLRCLTFLMRKFFFLHPAGDSPVSVYEYCLMFYYHASQKGVWLHLLTNLPWGAGQLLVGPPSHHFPRLTKPWSFRVFWQGWCSHLDYLGDCPQDFFQFVNSCQHCFKYEIKDMHTCGRSIFQLIFMLRKGLKVWRGFCSLVQYMVDSLDRAAVHMTAKPNLISCFCFRYARPYIAWVLLQ